MSVWVSKDLFRIVLPIGCTFWLQYTLQANSPVQCPHNHQYKPMDLADLSHNKRLGNRRSVDDTSDIIYMGEKKPNSEPVRKTIKQKNKSKLGGMLTRTKTLRGEENNKQRSSPAILKVDVNGSTRSVADELDAPPKTAPIKPDHRTRAFGGSNSSTPRNRSADRAVQPDTKSQKKDVQSTKLALY